MSCYKNVYLALIISIGYGSYVMPSQVATSRPQWVKDLQAQVALNFFQKHGEGFSEDIFNYVFKTVDMAFKHSYKNLTCDATKTQQYKDCMHNAIPGLYDKVDELLKCFLYHKDYTAHWSREELAVCMKFAMNCPIEETHVLFQIGLDGKISVNTDEFIKNLEGRILSCMSEVQDQRQKSALFLKRSSDIATQKELMQYVQNGVRIKCIHNKIDFKETLFKKMFIVAHLGIKDKLSDQQDMRHEDFTNVVYQLYHYVTIFITNLYKLDVLKNISDLQYQEAISSALNFPLEDIKSLIVCDNGRCTSKVRDFLLKFVGRMSDTLGSILNVSSGDDNLSKILLGTAEKLIQGDLRTCDAKQQVQKECAQVGILFSESLWNQLYRLVENRSQEVQNTARQLGDEKLFQLLASQVTMNFYKEIQEAILEKRKLFISLKQRVGQSLNLTNEFQEQDYDCFIKALGAVVEVDDLTVLACIQRNKEGQLVLSKQGVSEFREGVLVPASTKFGELIGQDFIQNNVEFISCPENPTILRQVVQEQKGFLKVQDLKSGSVPVQDKVGCIKRATQLPSWFKEIKNNIRFQTRQNKEHFLEEVFDQAGLAVDAACKYAKVNLKDKNNMTYVVESILEIAQKTFNMMDLYKNDACLAGVTQDQFEDCFVRALKLLPDECLKNLIVPLLVHGCEIRNLSQFMNQVEVAAKINIEECIREVQLAKVQALAALPIQQEKPKKLRIKKVKEVQVKEVPAVEPTESLVPQEEDITVLGCEVVEAVAKSYDESLEGGLSKIAREKLKKQRKEKRYEDKLAPAQELALQELQRDEEIRLLKEMDMEQQELRKQQAMRDRAAMLFKLKQEQEKVDFQELKNKCEAVVDPIKYGYGFSLLQEMIHDGRYEDTWNAEKLQLSYEATYNRHEAEFKELCCKSDTCINDVLADPGTVNAGHIIKKWLLCKEKEKKIDVMELAHQKRLYTLAWNALVGYVGFQKQQREKQSKQQIIEEQERIRLARQMNEPWILCDTTNAKTDGDGNYEYNDEWYYNNPYDHENSQKPCKVRRKIILADDVAPLTVVVPVNQEITQIRKPTRMTRGGRIR